MPDEPDDDGRGGAPTALRERPRRRRAGGAVVAAVREAVVVVLSALVLSLLVKTFLLQAFVIPSVSMEQTLLVGDRVLVNRLVPSPVGLQRGDVVVFQDSSGWLDDEPQPEQGAAAKALTFVGVLPDPGQGHLIKRVIGLPGDHVVGTVGGPTTVNGVAVDESAYLAPGAQPTEVDFDVTVPQGRIWVEGDNRQDSWDSRRHQDLAGGSVPLDDVVGRAVVIAWPLDRLGWLSDHAEVFAGVPAPRG